MVWDALIAWYLFLAGLGAGAFVFAAALGRTNPEAFKSRLAAMLLGLASVGIGTVLLVFDAKAGLHDPFRFILLLANFNSVMAWGTLILSCFLTVGFVNLVVSFVKKRSIVVLDGICVFLAAAVALYTGVLLGVVSAYPLWNLPLLPMLFVVSALGAGFAGASLVGQIVDRSEMKHVVFHEKLLVVLPVLEALLIAALLYTTYSASGVAQAAGQETVLSMLTGSFAPVFWIGLVLLGLVVPFVVDLVSLKKPLPLPAVMTTEFLVLVGGFSLRYLVVMAAIPIVAP